MISLQQDKSQGKKLSQIVLYYFVVLFILFTTTLLYWTYQSSTAFITEELQHSLHQRQVNAENSFERILADLEITVRYIAADTTLEESVGKKDRELTLEVLRRNLGSEMNSRLDILFVKDRDNRIWADDSSPFFDLQDVLPLIAADNVAYEIPSKLYTFSAEQSELVIVGTSIPLIRERTGQVIGTVFGGIVLNNDGSLVDSMRMRIQVESLLLLHAGRIVASTHHADTAIIKEAIGKLPVSSDEFRRLDGGYVAHYKALQIDTQASPLELVFIVKDSVFAELRASYLNKLVLLLLLIVGFSGVTFYFTKREIIAPLSNLSSYATQISQGKEAAYLAGRVLEFNQIGIVMSETVQGLKESSVQLQEEMTRRQLVMDELNIHRNSLEQIVENRTKELSAANDELTAKYSEIKRERTERLHAQEENRQLAEAVKNSPVSIVITDREGTIEYVNPKFSELTQYRFDEAIGQNPRILNAGVQSREHFKSMWDTILAGKDWHGEFCNRKKNGELFWELASISPIFDDTGTIQHFVAVKENITTRKLTETSLLAARKQAEEASKQKSQFLANMSHEIRTPMNAMIGLSELALETNLTEQQHDYLSKIHSSSKGLLTVLNDVLDYSKIEAGKLELEEHLFSLSEMIEEVGSIFVDQARQKGLELQIFLEESVPSFLYGDSSRLRQVLVNLVGNGLKFTQQGTVEIIVTLLGQAEDRVQLKFAVVDSGIGIPADKFARLFHPFSQVDTSHTRRYGGTGLGLAISSEFIEMMGGRLDVESVIGSGSTFSFILDFKSGGNEDIYLQEQQQSRKMDKLMAMQQLDGARVLLVEDNAINQQIAAEILAKAHVDVEVAANGAEAVEKYAASLKQGLSFAAILMDIQMPILDGYEATGGIREIELYQPGPACHVPIIAMTAHTMSGDREKGLDSGMDDYIGKPVSSNELFITLARWIHRNVGAESPAAHKLVDRETVSPVQEIGRLSKISKSVDLQKGIVRLEGNRTLYLRLLKEFNDQYCESRTEAERLLKQGEQESVTRLFHTVKGVAANLCVHDVQEAAAKLETAMSEGHAPHGLLDGYALAWREFSESLLVLEKAGCFVTAEEDCQVSSADKEKSSRIFATLLAQLDQMDFQAVKSWRELKPFLQTERWAEEIAAIDLAIMGFDFKHAEKMLAEIDIDSHV